MCFLTFAIFVFQQLLFSFLRRFDIFWVAWRIAQVDTENSNVFYFVKNYILNLTKILFLVFKINFFLPLTKLNSLMQWKQSRVKFELSFVAVSHKISYFIVWIIQRIDVWLKWSSNLAMAFYPIVIWFDEFLFQTNFFPDFSGFF